MPGNEGEATNPVDVQTRYANATKLLAVGQLDEATTEFVWLWKTCSASPRTWSGCAAPSW